MQSKFGISWETVKENCDKAAVNNAEGIGVFSLNHIEVDPFDKTKVKALVREAAAHDLRLIDTDYGLAAVSLVGEYA